MVDRKYVFNLIKLEQGRSQTALVAGANSISFVNVATVFIKIFDTNMQGRSNTKSFTKILPVQGLRQQYCNEQVNQHIFDRKK